jgi:hypothetical protein
MEPKMTAKTRHKATAGDDLQIAACPECGNPAEITRQATVASTDGPIEVYRVTCIDRHRFLMPIHTGQSGRPTQQDHASRESSR